ncbi:MAG: preprotein translocase subunit SecA [Anaerolineae bacterium]|nr:preprotein translocase subunit SecA [Anaerolineae bacterium]
MLKGLITKIVGDPAEKLIKQLRQNVDQINALEKSLERLSDDDLRARTDTFKAQLDEATGDLRERVNEAQVAFSEASGDERRDAEDELKAAQKALYEAEAQALDDIMVEAFATVREAAKRTIGQRHFDVQLIGGMVLHQGKVAEMKTGEGKTITATLSIYLNALTGRGVHLVTPNDYLSKVGAQLMGPIYHFLGLSVGVIQGQSNASEYQPSYLYDPHFQTADDRYQRLRPVPRKEAYAADVTYGTNNEFGFDYLRDNMVLRLEDRVQRELYFAIVDEVDNILIDEARTPLIISGPAEESAEYYVKFAQLVRKLREDDDYVIDPKLKVVTATEDGIEKMERLLGIPSTKTLYDPEYYEMTPYFENALKAQALFHLDKEYIVKDGEVIIVDEFTGRLMHGRRFSEGLHQAIEAKEGVPVQRENLTLATITFQNYFRMYHKLAGMTGTAKTEEEEFQRIYDLDVIPIPTHRPMIRADNADQVYKAERSKFVAVVKEIEEMHRQGRPVLVGTTSVERSEMLADMLRRRGVPHEVLNAKLHEKEAGIIAQAGRLGAVTIATNMAGRGVDILLGGNPEGIARERLRQQGLDLTELEPGVWEQALQTAQQETEAQREKVIALGGLHIVGTERHEARRIDNQLRGRAGRQGDPGSSRFYVALDDELMVRFGGQNVAGIMDRFGLEDDIPIEHNLVTRSIENSQVKVEGYNFDLRKHLLQYDDVINQQRAFIYQQRTDAMSKSTLRPTIMGMVEKEISALVEQYTQGERAEWDLAGLHRDIQRIIPLPATEDGQTWQDMRADDLEEHLIELAEDVYDQREQEFGPEIMREIERAVLLRTIDNRWIHHLTALDELRTGISLRAYGQQDPLVTFKREGFLMFGQLTEMIQEDVSRLILHVVPESSAPPQRRSAIPRATRLQGAGGQVQSSQPTPMQKRAAMGSAAELGRNDPCPCGSGKKFKNCHMGRETELAMLLQQRGQKGAPQTAGAGRAGQGAPVTARPQAAPVSPAKGTPPRQGRDGKGKRR